MSLMLEIKKLLRIALLISDEEMRFIADKLTLAVKSLENFNLSFDASFLYSSSYVCNWHVCAIQMDSKKENEK